MGAKVKNPRKKFLWSIAFPKTPYQYLSIPDLPTSGYRD